MNPQRPTGAVARGTAARGGGAGQQLQTTLPAFPYPLLPPPNSLYQHPPQLYSYLSSLPLQSLQYSLAPIPPAMYPWPPLQPHFPSPHLPYFHHLPHYTTTQQPVYITSLPDGGTEAREELPWLQQLNQSDHELSDCVIRKVGMEMVESVLPDMAREIVSATINDIICSYIGHRWARHPHSYTTTMKPHPPSQLQPIRLPPPPLLRPMLPEPPYRQPPHDTETSDPLTLLEDCHEQVTHCKDPTELSQLVGTVLLEKMIFTQLLTSDLDGGATMATRTQSSHILNALLFQELLTKLVRTTDIQ